jgi:hypothetical protein
LVLGRPILLAFVFLAGVDVPLVSSSFVIMTSSPALNSRSTLDGLRAGVDSLDPSVANVCFRDRFTGLLAAAFFCSSSSAFRFSCNCNLLSSSTEKVSIKFYMLFGSKRVTFIIQKKRYDFSWFKVDLPKLST